MGVASISNDNSVEFEAKRKSDGSWHPCRASLSSSTGKLVITLEFESDEKDVISSKEDALERLRLRSIPLENSQCSNIKEGDLVLCMNKNQFKNLYFDAIVEKTHKVKHSNRIHCRCAFEIKWVAPELDSKIEIVPSTSLMKLSDNHINSHKPFTLFFNSLEPSNSMDAPSNLSPLEEGQETTLESNLQEILKRQVEDITKLAGGSDNLGDIHWGIKKVPPYSKDEFRRTTRSQKKEQVDLESKNLDKRPLNPLAACAALASALHKQLLNEPAFSTVQLEKEYEHNLLSGCVKKHDQKILELQRMRIVPDHYIKSRGNGLANLTRGARNTESSSFTSSTASISARDVDVSMYEESESTTSFQAESFDSATGIVKHSAKLITLEKSNSAIITGRLTRSAAKKQLLNSVPEVHKEFLIKTLMTPESKNVTPSRHQKVDDNTNIKQDLEKFCWGEEIGYLDSVGNQGWLKETGDLDTPKNESNKRSSISSSVDTKTGTNYASSNHDKGMFFEDGESLPAKKTRVSLEKPVLRSSPRLRSLPRSQP